MILARRHLASVFTLLVAVVLAATVYSTLNWPPQPRTFPLVVGIPALLLTLVQLVAEVVRTHRRGDSPRGDDDERLVDLAVDRDVPAATVVRRAGAMALWTVGYVVAILTFGFILASPVFVAAYLTVHVRKAWIVLLCVVLVMLLQIGIFHMIMRSFWLPGWVPGPQEFLLDLLG